MKKIIFISTIFLASCGIIQEEHVVGNYYVVAGDTRDQMTLSYKSSDSHSGSYGIVVDNCVFAIGHNDKYIILKQHPWNFMNSKHPNREITNYYVVKVESVYVPNNNPLNEFQFSRETKRLGIENIRFSTIYKDLE
jgi:hypothetical protein